MGYFSAAFVFNQDPPWDRISPLAKPLAMVGVRHSASSLRLLAVRERGVDEPNCPFSTFVERRPPDLGTGIIAKSNENVRKQIEHLVAVAEVLSHEYYADAVVRTGLQLGCDLHDTLAIPVLFFAANDDGLNVSFLFDAGKLAAFKMDGENGMAELRGGRVEVTLIDFGDQDETEEDERDGDSDDDMNPALSAIEEIADVFVNPARVDEEDLPPNQLCSAALQLWPASWPDPGATIGIGSWDPFHGFPDGFKTEFIRS